MNEMSHSQPTASLDDICKEALSPETFDQLTEEAFGALRMLVKQAKKDNVDVDLEMFVHDVAEENNCTIADLTRLQLYRANLKASEKRKREEHERFRAGAPSEGQRNALRSFHVDPADFETAGEASDFITVMVEQIEARKKSKLSSKKSPSA